MYRGLTLLPGLIVPFLIAFLAGCAHFTPPDRPQDFPFHASDHPLFDLHWRLDREDGVASAVGLVEAARVGGIGWVIVELKGIDREGRAVSRGLGRTFPGSLHRWETQPFVARLRPTGQEERFDLSVWAYGWANEADSRGDSRSGRAALLGWSASVKDRRDQ